MNIEITIDGETTPVEVDPDLDKFTLRELVRLEAALGGDVMDKLMGVRGRGVPLTPRPSVLQAIIWAKVATMFPQVGLDDFDLDIADVAGAILPKNAETPLPMDIDGEGEVTATVKAGDSGNA